MRTGHTYAGQDAREWWHSAPCLPIWPRGACAAARGVLVTRVATPAPCINARTHARMHAPAGKVLATGHDDGSVALYNVEKCQLMQRGVAGAKGVPVVSLCWVDAPSATQGMTNYQRVGLRPFLACRCMQTRPCTPLAGPMAATHTAQQPTRCPNPRSCSSTATCASSAAPPSPPTPRPLPLLQRARIWTSPAVHLLTHGPPRLK